MCHANVIPVNRKPQPRPSHLSDVNLQPIGKRGLGGKSGSGLSRSLGNPNRSKSPEERRDRSSSKSRKKASRDKSAK